MEHAQSVFQTPTLTKTTKYIAASLETKPHDPQANEKPSIKTQSSLKKKGYRASQSKRQTQEHKKPRA